MKISKSLVEEEVYKLGLTDYNYELLLFLAKDMSQYYHFMKYFWKGVDEQSKSIRDFRQSKIKKLNVDYKRFISEYLKDNKIGLELLFQHPIEKEDIKLLHRKLNSEQLTLRKIFDLHKKEPRKKMLRFIL